MMFVVFRCLRGTTPNDLVIGKAKSEWLQPDRTWSFSPTEIEGWNEYDTPQGACDMWNANQTTHDYHVQVRFESRTEMQSFDHKAITLRPGTSLYCPELMNRHERRAAKASTKH